MKIVLLPLALLSALSLSPAAHADTLYTISNGVLTNYLSTTVVGSYSGTFTLNSYYTLESGNFSATVNGTTYTNLNMIVGNLPTSGYAAFFDTAGDHFNFALFTAGGQNAPTLCNVALCGSGDALFDPATGGNFSVNGGTLTGGAVAAATVTPEPSSLLLLGSGALGLAGALRRRLRRA